LFCNQEETLEEGVNYVITKQVYISYQGLPTTSPACDERDGKVNYSMKFRIIMVIPRRHAKLATAFLISLLPVKIMAKWFLEFPE